MGYSKISGSDLFARGTRRQSHLVRGYWVQPLIVVLATNGVLKLRQDEAYGDICLSMAI